MGAYNPHLDPSLDGGVINDRLNGRWMTVSGVTPITLAGNRNGRRGFFVAKPGYDVRTATNSQLIFNSNQNVFKIANDNGTVIDLSSGFVDFPLPLPAGSSNSFTMSSGIYNHNLGFVPQIVMSRQSQTPSAYSAAAPGIQDYWMDGHGSGASGLVIANTILYVITTTNNVTFRLDGFWSNSGTGTYVLPPFIANLHYKVYLLQETAN